MHVLDDARQSEVGHFALVVLADEHVARCQVAVDVVARLEVGHALGYLRGHVDERVERQPLAARRLQVVEQTAVAHELGDNVDGLLGGAEGVELDELGVADALHESGLGAEVALVHALLECLDGHAHLVDGEDRLPHVAELALADALLEREQLALDLEVLHETVREALGDGRELAGAAHARHAQLHPQAVRLLRVVVDECRQRAEWNLAIVDNICLMNVKMIENVA